MRTELLDHFCLLGTDEDKPEEDLVRSLLDVISYSMHTIERQPEMLPKILKHMRSEWFRIQGKISSPTRYNANR